MVHLNSIKSKIFTR